MAEEYCAYLKQGGSSKKARQPFRSGPEREGSSCEAEAIRKKRIYGEKEKGLSDPLFWTVPGFHDPCADRRGGRLLFCFCNERGRGFYRPCHYPCDRRAECGARCGAGGEGGKVAGSAEADFRPGSHGATRRR